MKKRLAGQQAALRIYILAVCLGILMAAFIITAGLVKFEPMKIYDWTNVPSVSCPLKKLHTSYISEIKSGPYSIGRLQGDAFWEDSNGARYGGTPVDIKVAPKEKSETPSIVSRVTPPVAGDWKIGFEGTLKGKMFYIVSRYQTVEAISSKSIHVLPKDDPKCVRRK